MKLNKIIGMTAALLIGVGTVTTSHAAGEKNRGPRKGAHVKKEGGAKAHAQQDRETATSSEDAADPRPAGRPSGAHTRYVAKTQTGGSAQWPGPAGRSAGSR